MTETLPIDVPAQHTRWRLHTLQLVNWGSFHGHHSVTFHPDSTLLSGASGTGKSTLLDAWLALMMPSDTPFNGASNETGGRARGENQRNLVSYLRGKINDVTDTHSGEKRQNTLRGANGEHIWGALAGTFLNDAGTLFTVLRLYFLRAGGQTNADVTTTYATFAGSFDLSTLEPIAATRFEKRSLRAVGLQPYATFREFEDTIHTRLGIGGGDGGRKAMRLLSRVQAGMKISRVDTLYKSMVLERPITYEVADQALEHFADLEASYAKMLDEAEKLKTLSRLPDLMKDLDSARQRIQIIDQLGAERIGPTPFRLWRLRTHRGLLDKAVECNREELTTITAQLDTAKADERELRSRLDAIAEEKRANGGDAIDTRQRQIQELMRHKDAVYSNTIKFQTRTEAISLVIPGTTAEFSAAQTEASAFLETFQTREAELHAEAETIRDQIYPLKNQAAELLKERQSLQNRSGMVPHRLHSARVRMAEAAGLDPENDLPFVAELMDVRSDEEDWRDAIETTLGGIARTVLVDRNQFDRLSRAIDPIRITPRINFQAVSLMPHQEFLGDPDYVSSKLVFKDSPFSNWVQNRISAPGTDHLCVPNAAALHGNEPRVTPIGQTRSGDRGAHGSSSEGPIIGFTSKRRLLDIERTLVDLDQQIKALNDQLQQIERRQASLRAQKEAHTYVGDTTWDDLDLPGVTTRINALHEEITRLRANSSILDALQAEEELLIQLLEAASRERHLADDALSRLTKEHGRLVDSQDRVQDEIDVIDRTQSAVVIDEQQAYLDTLFAASWDIEDLAGFATNVDALRKRLSEHQQSAGKDENKAVNAMEAMFESYKQRWTENNLGISIASVYGYREILDRIREGNLHEHRLQWRNEFAKWSSDDLLMLGDSFDAALSEIEERLEPINRILATLSFGGVGVLQIRHRRINNEELRVFRRDLRALSSGIADELTDQQIETRFRKLKTFMEKIAVPDRVDSRNTAQRDRYLDVRQHVVITAEALDNNGQVIATYDALGGKSGGETQELVAFIVGAALRYQLGDESRSRPRFAPVLLDEAFIKADSEFAGRAVTAWQSLGFQMIIGAPLDKVTTLEPYMNLMLAITKSMKNYSFINPLVDAGDTEDDAA